ncbi:hypothetical protein LCGC14_2415710 [marine sediment metagenome]|uniref:Uncharacterized protein n=1 Tax=marine sediment metagenome TaxID=412755 RepID=A0A0F9EKJ0_9ZZZZ
MEGASCQVVGQSWTYSDITPFIATPIWLLLLRLGCLEENISGDSSLSITQNAQILFVDAKTPSLLKG